MKKYAPKKRSVFGIYDVIFILLVAVLVYLSVFQLPWFSEKKISSTEGDIHSVRLEQMTGTSRRKWVFFEMNGQAYYYSISDTVKSKEIDTIVSRLTTCEQTGQPVEVIVTTERDYRDFLDFGDNGINDRLHAVALSGEDIYFPISTYKRNVWILRSMLLGIGLLLVIVRIIIYCI